MSVSLELRVSLRIYFFLTKKPFTPMTHSANQRTARGACFVNTCLFFISSNDGVLPECLVLTFIVPTVSVLEDVSLVFEGRRRCEIARALELSVRPVLCVSPVTPSSKFSA